MRLLFLVLLSGALYAADFAAPAGTRPALRRPGAASILPGGRVVVPIGKQFPTGSGPFGLAVSPDGKTIVSADGGPEGFSITVFQQNKQNRWERRRVRTLGEHEQSPDDDEWRSVFMGIAFEDNRQIFASEGNSGRIRLISIPNDVRSFVNLNHAGLSDSYTGDLAYDPDRRLLYVVDQANFRVAVIDAKKKQILSSIRVGRLPFSLALSPDRKRVYVTNLGMFEYSPIPGADKKNARDTGIPFPAFGFPSPESETGATRETARGPVKVPGLGDPNVEQSNSLCVINVADPAKPVIEGFIRTGLPFSAATPGGSSPSGVTAAGDRIYVSNAHNDSITVIDAKTLKRVADVPIQIPGLERLRGVLPIGLAYHEASRWLLVAEAGINAVGVLDTETLQFLGHLPAGWFPSAIKVRGDTVYVTNAKGNGTGPNPQLNRLGTSFQGDFRAGSLSIFPLPGRMEIMPLTARVFEANGLIPLKQAALPLPSGLKYAVLIVKENRTFDEVFGDIDEASNGKVNGAPGLARFGRAGYAESPRHSGTEQRLGLRKVNVTPNHHEIAARWCFSDNFYADSEVSVDGHHWLVGSYPNAWTETSLMASYGGQKDFRLPTTAPGRLLNAEGNSSVHPEEQLEAGAIWHHLERHGVTFRNYGEGFELAGVDEGEGLKPTGGRFLTNVPMPDPLYRNTSRDYPVFNTNIPDQYRATQFINEIEKKYIKGGEPFPRFLYIHLPEDHLTKPRPEDGYPYEASYMADNDYALGRILEYLSRTPWWKEMAIFITEDDAQGWVDHVDSHRTVLLVASPYVKHNYVSHVNSSFPGLLKTVFRLLGIPPLNLFDATASDLSDCFTDKPDYRAYDLMPVDSNIFDPNNAREPADPKPSDRMDDPKLLKEQHKQ